MGTSERKAIVNNFHQLYYNLATTGGTWANTKWQGADISKCPMDMWIYQELIFKLKPDLIFETGTARGGSALFLAHMLDLAGGSGKVITVDITHYDNRPQHPRIEHLTGSSVGPEISNYVKEQAKGKKSILVILDSDHTRDHVLKELEIYSPLIPVGGYIIVEDSNVNGHPAFPEHGPGPMEAIELFTRNNSGFITDELQEKFLMTFNPKGYIQRVA